MRNQSHLCAFALAAVTAFVSPGLSVAEGTLSVKKQVTLLGTCAEVRPTDERALTYIFTFDVEEVREGTFEDPQVVFAMTTDSGGGDLLAAVSGNAKGGKKSCSARDAFELIFVVPPANPHFAKFGVNATVQKWDQTDKAGN